MDLEEQVAKAMRDFSNGICPNGEPLESGDMRYVPMMMHMRNENVMHAGQTWKEKDNG